jgi:hypothetical protein
MVAVAGYADVKSSAHLPVPLFHIHFRTLITVMSADKINQIISIKMKADINNSDAGGSSG